MQTLTYTLTDGFTAAGATLSNDADGTVTIDGTPGIFAWNVADNLGVTLATDVTVTITNPDPEANPQTIGTTDLDINADASITLTGSAGTVGGNITSFDLIGDVLVNDVVSTTHGLTITPTSDGTTSVAIAADSDLVATDVVKFSFTVTNDDPTTSATTVVTMTVGTVTLV